MADEHRYRVLNCITVNDKYPIPVVDELLDELKGAQEKSFESDLRRVYVGIAMSHGVASIAVEKGDFL